MCLPFLNTNTGHLYSCLPVFLSPGPLPTSDFTCTPRSVSTQVTTYTFQRGSSLLPWSDLISAWKSCENAGDLFLLSCFLCLVLLSVDDFSYRFQVGLDPLRTWGLKTGQSDPGRPIGTGDIQAQRHLLFLTVSPFLDSTDHGKALFSSPFT